MSTLRPSVVVHGGAWDIPDEAVDDHLNGVKIACDRAWEIVSAGGTALDAVEAAVRLLEDDPTFDAGRGSFLTSAQEVEMDAVIATDAWRVGSVCGLQNIANPISVARRVMENTKEVVLVGAGAKSFALSEGFVEVPTAELLVGRELERFLAIEGRASSFDAKGAFGKYEKVKTPGMGTVGCVARDQHGQVAVAVSTGGTPFKRPGRVGDTPLWGAGGYADAGSGAAATGYGEDLLKMHATKTAVDANVHLGMGAQAAVEHAIALLDRRLSGLGGLIMLGRDGDLGMAFNTPRMARAWRTNDEGESSARIEK